MLTICGKTITISKGDTFDVTFRLYGYSLLETDIIIFTIKDKIHYPNELIEKKITGISGDVIRVQIPAEKMEVLSGGRHFYDLLCQSGDAVITLCYPEQIFIKEVVHNGAQ